MEQGHQSALGDRVCRILSYTVSHFTYLVFDILHKTRDDIRIKAITLLLKIFSNIINHPTKLEKYGDLHAKKINQKLSECGPAGELLSFSGFTLSNDETRLMWTQTDENLMIIKHIYNTLSSMINPAATTDINQNQSPPQSLFQQMQHNSIKSKNVDTILTQKLNDLTQKLNLLTDVLSNLNVAKQSSV